MSLRRLDQDLLTAISHPLRLRLLARYMDEVASPTQLATELDEPLGKVAYHTRALVELGSLELVRTVPRRGALEHFYRGVVTPLFTDEDWAKLPRGKRHRLVGTVLRTVLSEITRTYQAGTFETRTDLHVSRTPLQLDEAAWAELNAMLDAVLERAMELRAQPAADDAIASSLVLMHFPRPNAARA
jgi:DNA-binding transcriptional ArsR family regulator